MYCYGQQVTGGGGGAQQTYLLETAGINYWFYEIPLINY